MSILLYLTVAVPIFVPASILTMVLDGRVCNIKSVYHKT